MEKRVSHHSWKSWRWHWRRWWRSSSSQCCHHCQSGSKDHRSIQSSIGTSIHKPAITGSTYVATWPSWTGNGRMFRQSPPIIRGIRVKASPQQNDTSWVLGLIYGWQFFDSTSNSYSIFKCGNVNRFINVLSIWHIFVLQKGHFTVQDKVKCYIFTDFQCFQISNIGLETLDIW